ncbi:MAG: PEP-CTERM sorting domain-containing protein [Verrucomicrobiaceae bacterium]
MFRSPSIRSLAFWLTMVSHGFSLNIVVDYSNDAANGNFFGLRPVAKAAVDAAAADLSTLLSPTNMTAISPSGSPNVDLISGINGSTHVNADWDLFYNNPSSNVSTGISSPSIPSNTFKVFVGMMGLGGSLGQGSASDASLTLSASGFGSQLAGAMSNLQSASNAYMGRGGGPVIGTLSGSLTLGGNTSSYSLSYGPAIGSLSFNNDTDNNNVTDSLGVMDAFWHYNHTTSVAAGKFDLYTVALHEMMHGLGVGASETWTNLSSGTTWLGANAIALNGGTGAGLLDPDGQHLASGLMSTNIYTGLAQEVALDNAQTSGQRKMLTQMDVAILKDLGYQVAPVPEPSAFVLVMAASLVFGIRRRRVHASA